MGVIGTVVRAAPLALVDLTVDNNWHVTNYLDEYRSVVQWVENVVPTRRSGESRFPARVRGREWPK